MNSIAIDGPAGAGKSTIAKRVAKTLGFIYVDTGAMYRAMAIFMLEKGVTVGDAERAAAYAAGKAGDGSPQKERIEVLSEQADITIRYEKEKDADGNEQDVQHVFLNGEDVTGRLRTQETGDMASAVSTNGKVRQRLVALQQKMAQETPVVMDGRDIGTVVLPEAKLKIYLTATSDERARRRLGELREKGEDADFDLVKREIEERDLRDMTRAESPLKKADDAIEVDTSAMTIDEVTTHILELWQAA
ncbi:MAG: (d)CMP kinase [Lachnospiraceae bacterium]|nr:(d)CMP kinase [Lachnospiraceae bacterium]